MKSFTNFKMIFIILITLVITQSAMAEEVIKTPLDASPPSVTVAKANPSIIQKIVFTEEEK